MAGKSYIEGSPFNTVGLPESSFCTEHFDAFLKKNE